MPTPFPLELGLDTFGDTSTAPDGSLSSHAQTIREVVEQGVLADQVGLDFIGIGELIAGVGCPALFVMEGGYMVDEIGINAVNVLHGYESKRA